MSNNALFNRSLIEISDFSVSEIWQLLQFAELIKSSQQIPQSLEDRIIAHAFFEPSTRTRLSFETASLTLGGKVIGFTDSQATSSAKGESLEDSIKILSLYADAIIIRHPDAGSAKRADSASLVPVINAGDGANQHPTQTLTDLFTIWETQGRLDNLKICLAGDLKYSRTIHSLIEALVQFGPQTLYGLSPKHLALPESYQKQIKERGSQWFEISAYSEIISDLNILYMTRLQQERFTTEEHQCADVNNSYLKASDLAKVKAHFKILHPLPRLKEIPVDLDQSPYAYYFEQAENGLFVRQALLHNIFAPKLNE